LDLADAKRSLKRTITGRKTAEQALKKSGGHSEQLMEKSRRLQKDLRSLTHRILKAHEEKRRAVSRDLQDEIAQSLLGINVRLLTLKKEASVNANGLTEDIAATQRLLDRSMKSIKRFALEFSKRHAA
jgi:signal transduction histidine kinase